MDSFIAGALFAAVFFLFGFAVAAVAVLLQIPVN